MLIRRDRVTKGNDIITVYRPRKVSELIGNEVVKQSINSYMSSNSLPHTILFSGPAGCGKTTAARIVAAGLNCESAETMTPEPCLTCSSCKAIIDGFSMAVSEINVGRDSGKADIDKSVSNLMYAPMGARHKVIIFDEAHKLTSAAKDMLLKVTEDTYSHVYIMFCTDEPEKLMNPKKKDDPFLRRCTWLKLSYIDDYDMLSMVNYVTEAEGAILADEILQLIVDKASGVPSNALKYLGMVINHGSNELDKVKELIGDPAFLEDSVDTKELGRLILNHHKYPDVLSNIFNILNKALKNNPPETIRMGICGYFVKCLQNGNSKVSAISSDVLDVLLEPLLFDSATSRHKLFHMFYKIILKVKGSNSK